MGSAWTGPSATDIRIAREQREEIHDRVVRAPSDAGSGAGIGRGVHVNTNRGAGRSAWRHACNRVGIGARQTAAGGEAARMRVIQRIAPRATHVRASAQGREQVEDAIGGTERDAAIGPRIRPLVHRDRERRGCIRARSGACHGVHIGSGLVGGRIEQVAMCAPRTHPAPATIGRSEQLSHHAERRIITAYRNAPGLACVRRRGLQHGHRAHGRWAWRSTGHGVGVDAGS